MLKACIFDLDGVIVDTARFHYLAWKRLADELGIPFTEADNEHLKGVSRVDSLHFLLKLGNTTLSPADFEESLKRKNAWFLEYIAQITPADALEGVPAFLAELQASPLRIALGSASKNALEILDRLELTHYFEALIDGHQVAQAKPNPEVFLKGAANLGLSPAECLVFEDGIAGVQAGHRAGMKVIGIGQADVLQEADFVMAGFAGFTVGKLQEIFASLA